MSAREAILGAVRASLADVRSRLRPAAPGRPAFPRFGEGLGTRAARVERFRARLAGVRGESVVARDVVDAGTLLAAWLAARGADRLALSDGALAAEVAEAARAHGGLRVAAPPHEREDLLTAPAGLTGAILGVAETGTLVLASGDERARLVSLVPPLAVAVLHADALVPTLEDALVRLRPDDPDRSSRALTFVTGPSRTADIEMTLVVGVHGPKEVLVLVLDPAAPALVFSDPPPSPTPQPGAPA